MLKNKNTTLGAFFHFLLACLPLSHTPPDSILSLSLSLLSTTLASYPLSRIARQQQPSEEDTHLIHRKQNINRQNSLLGWPHQLSPNGRNPFVSSLFLRPSTTWSWPPPLWTFIDVMSGSTRCWWRRSGVGGGLQISNSSSSTNSVKNTHLYSS